MENEQEQLLNDEFSPTDQEAMEEQRQTDLSLGDEPEVEKTPEDKTVSTTLPDDDTIPQTTEELIKEQVGEPEITLEDYESLQEKHTNLEKALDEERTKRQEIQNAAKRCIAIHRMQWRAIDLFFYMFH